MKKIVKIIAVLTLFLLVVPALAGFAITYLWNGILTNVCGFQAITFCQSVGLFILGQLLCGGFILGIFMLGGSLHRAIHSHADWHNRWHKMTDKERSEFIIRRRKHFGFHNRPYNEEDAGKE